MSLRSRYVPVGVVLGGLLVSALYLRANAGAFVPVAESLRFTFQLMLAGSVIAVLRNEVGMSTFGVFGPAILVFSWLEIGPLWGFLLIAYVFVVAASARVAIGGLDLGTAHRVATLLIVAGVALFVVDAVSQLKGVPAVHTALLFPVVLTAWYAERFVGGVDETGWAPASLRLGATLVAITTAFLVTSYEPLVTWFVRTPEAWVGLVAVNLVLGAGTDTRLGEYLRFETLRRSLGAGDGAILTMRVRNREFVSRYNPAPLLRSLDKARIKELLHGLDIPTPETYLVVDDEAGLDALESLLAERDAFVVKPAGGSGGRDVLVVRGTLTEADETDAANDIDDGSEINDGDEILADREINDDVVSGDDGTPRFDTNRGPMTAVQVVGHARRIVTGGTADYGARGSAIVEALVTPDPHLAELADGGVPDLRVITLHGYPVMAMVRLPTEESSGTANLHSGAVGVAVDLATGEAAGGYQQTRDRFLETHPDTGASLSFALPDWPATLEIASRASLSSGLGYTGVDIVFDADRGPLVLEVNRRPGLGIQNVNLAGLLGRLRFVEVHGESGRFAAAGERVRRAMDWAADDWAGADQSVPPVADDVPGVNA